MGVHYYAFAIIALAASASALKCFTGTSDSKTSGNCTTGFDRCTKITTSGVAAYACGAKSLATGDIKDNACTEVSVITTCLCSTDDCNSATTQSATQAIIIFAAASMMKLVLT